MKTYVILFMMGLLSSSCSGQKKDLSSYDTKTPQEETEKQPQGTWKVDREFDEKGNLIRYDSIYSWSSSDIYKDLNTKEKDSLLEKFKSRFFQQYSQFEDDGFENLFNPDSAFSKRYFNDDFFNSDFGKDFIDMDKITQEMIRRQKALLEKYQPKYIAPKTNN
jgi:hypothetical protein